MIYEESLAALRKRWPSAADWVEIIVERAGTSDADWAILEAAGEACADLEECSKD